MNNFPLIPASKNSLSNRKPVHVFGINDAWYTTSQKIKGKVVRCPIYTVWRNMLLRCFSDKAHKTRPKYTDCTVCDEWLKFSNFRAWMIRQDWEDKALDKDLLIPNNKIYGPITCVFVDNHTNCLLIDCGASRGEFPQGVSYHKRDGKYVAQARVNGKNNFLGYYETPEEAEAVYRFAKAREIERVAHLQDDQRVTQALLLRADKLRNVTDWYYLPED